MFVCICLGSFIFAHVVLFFIISHYLSFLVFSHRRFPPGQFLAASHKPFWAATPLPDKQVLWRSQSEEEWASGTKALLPRHRTSRLSYLVKSFTGTNLHKRSRRAVQPKSRQNKGAWFTPGPHGRGHSVLVKFCLLLHERTTLGVSPMVPKSSNVYRTFQPCRAINNSSC